MGGILYDIVVSGKRTPWTMLRTCMLSYPIDVFHLSFNFLCLMLLSCIYLIGANLRLQLRCTAWCHYSVYRKLPKYHCQVVRTSAGYKINQKMMFKYITELHLIYHNEVIIFKSFYSKILLG
jgi:hypothetical protein